MPSFSGRTPGIGAIQKEPVGLRKREGGSLREHKHIESVKDKETRSTKETITGKSRQFFPGNHSSLYRGQKEIHTTKSLILAQDER